MQHFATLTIQKLGFFARLYRFDAGDEEGSISLEDFSQVKTRIAGLASLLMHRLS